MVFLITAALLILGYHAVAQDPDCDFRQNIAATERFYLESPGYPRNYGAGRMCRYVLICPSGYNCRADCKISIPSTINCSGDRFLVSLSGDPTLTGATVYCGSQSFTAVSTARTLTMGLIASANSVGGVYSCTLSAQAAPVTPAPPVCRCGERKQTRIVGGEVTRVNEYTMMAGLIEVSTDQIHCGGVIISNRYILTAAHCLYNYRPAELLIIVGTYYIDQGRTGTLYNSQQFIIHEQFNINTYDYDIALVLTQQEIQFNDNVQPVCLPFKYSSTPDFTGTNVTLLGWGTTSFGGPTSNPLRKVDVNVISQNTCRQTETDITNRQLCTLTRGKDACQFDSGGPALFTDYSTGFLFSVGLISRGAMCASQRPGVQTNVVTLLNWVVNNANARFCIIR